MLFSQCLVFEVANFNQTQSFKEDIYKENNCKRKISILGKSFQNLVGSVSMEFLNHKNCEIRYMVNISRSIWYQKMSKNISLGRPLVSSYLNISPSPPPHPPPKACCNISFVSLQKIFLNVQVPLSSQMCFHQVSLIFHQGLKGGYMLLKSLSWYLILFVLFFPLINLNFSELFSLHVFNSLKVQFPKGKRKGYRLITQSENSN